MTTAEVLLQDMIRIANDLDFEPTAEIGQDILSRKTMVAKACVGVVEKAMDVVGGRGFYRKLGLERLFRDVQGAKYHPLPEKSEGVLNYWGILKQPDGGEVGGGD